MISAEKEGGASCVVTELIPITVREFPFSNHTVFMVMFEATQQGRCGVTSGERRFQREERSYATTCVISPVSVMEL